MTPWRIIAIGLGGATAVLAAGAAGNMLGGFLFVGAVGVGRLVQGVGKPQPS